MCGGKAERHGDGEKARDLVVLDRAVHPAQLHVGKRFLTSFNKRHGAFNARLIFYEIVEGSLSNRRRGPVVLIVTAELRQCELPVKCKRKRRGDLKIGGDVGRMTTGKRGARGPEPGGGAQRIFLIRNSGHGREVVVSRCNVAVAELNQAADPVGEDRAFAVSRGGFIGDRFSRFHITLIIKACRDP